MGQALLTPVAMQWASKDPGTVSVWAFNGAALTQPAEPLLWLDVTAFSTPPPFPRVQPPEDQPCLELPRQPD